MTKIAVDFALFAPPMPDNCYRVFGDAVGQVRHDGKTLKN